jgi:alpha-tubulin suppressor-like RCC1 family protein
MKVDGIPSGHASSLTAGAYHTCAFNGVWIYCWGNNQYGQLGDGTTINRTTPTAVAEPMFFVEAVVAGGGHTCAVESRAQTQMGVRCWGLNDQGQLGDGTTDNRQAPVSVPGLSMVADASLGAFHTCAVTFDDGAWCWGSNLSGELGDGTHTGRSSPVRVTGVEDDSSPISIEVGAQHSCTAELNGWAYSWGYNHYGQVGDGTATDRSTGTRVMPLSKVMQVSAGLKHTCAISDGEVYCWGGNSYGQAGGDLVDRSVPELVIWP